MPYTLPPKIIQSSCIYHSAVYPCAVNSCHNLP